MSRPRGNTTRCPHCDTTCRTIKSQQLTPLVREITYLCPECNYAFVASLSPVRTISPSDRPREDVRIPAA